MKVPFIDLAPQTKLIQSRLLSAWKKILTSQRFILGEYGQALERSFASYHGVPEAVGVASGSDAIYLALRALDIGSGDEVITTPYTFFASAGSIVRTGAKVVYCDIDPKTYNMDSRLVAKKITHKTRAILPVHIYGLSCDMDPLLKLARSRSIHIVEDAAQSIGATYHGQKTGTLGDLGCFSFYPTKNLGGAGDAGMVVTRSSKLAMRIKALRNHGGLKKYHHDEVGVNSRLDELQAASLLLKLPYIDRWNRSRQSHASYYNEALKGLPLETPFVPEGYTSNYHLYTIRCERRDGLSDYLAQKGIGAGVYYPVPLHLQPCFKDQGYKIGFAPKSESACREVLSLPMYAELTLSQKKAVVEAVRSFYKRS